MGLFLICSFSRALDQFDAINLSIRIQRDISRNVTQF